MALARIFFVCALPFILVESTIFREFFAMVAPTMKLPSRHKLSGVLLKRVRDELHHSHVIKLINQHKYVSLVTVGWTDTNSSSIMNFMVVAPGMSSVFWSSWSTRSKQHTAEYITGEIDKVIAEIERDTTAKVIAVVTDNAKNMRSATGSIHSGHHVVSGGCSAHVLNLLMQGVCQFPAVKAIHLRAVAVTRFVRDHLALLDEFKVLQKGVRGEGARARILSLPVPTRWYSVYNCMRCVLENSQLLEKLFLSPEYEQFRDRYRGTPARRQKLHYIMALVRDDRFWNNLRTVVRMLNPMIEALRNLEADNMYVSGVYKWFRWLRYHATYGVTSPEQEVELENAHANRALGIELLSSTASRITVEVAGNVTGSDEDELHNTSPDDERLVEGGRYENVAELPVADLQKFIRERIKKRWQYVHTNAMAIAFMLDPTTDLDDFVGSDNSNVDKQIREMATRCRITTTSTDPELTAEILKFKSMKRGGGENFRNMYAKSNPRDYWNAMSSKEYPLLHKIADIVFAIPTSSAASERAWSILDHIHSKRRNRLSVEKVEMLAYIYINYGTIKSGEVDLARHQSYPDCTDVDD